MKKLLIINILLCILTASLTSCSEKTASENNSKTTEEPQTASAETNTAEQTTANITDQPASVPEGNGNAEETPSIAESEPHSMDRLSLGGSHTDFVTEDGSLYVWGCGFEYQLGNNEHNIAESPIKIMDNVDAVSLGNGHSGAITKDGGLYMWGNNRLNGIGGMESVPPHYRKTGDAGGGLSYFVFYVTQVYEGQEDKCE
ncbi:MAG: hypothetical protein GXY08_04835 [Ruminococcus sp.]|nr:hypothetical protein [Ruminococcus sp.]